MTHSVRTAGVLVEIDEKEGIKKAIELLENSDTPFYREEVLNILKKYSNTDFGYDSLKNKEKNHQAIRNFLAWWQEKYFSN